MLRILVASCAFGFGVFINNMMHVEQTLTVELIKPQESEFKLIIPKSIWEPIFFKAIDERAGIANLSSLRVELRKNDLELRLWNGFGLTLLEGFVLRRVSGKWSPFILLASTIRNSYQLPNQGGMSVGANW